MQEYNHTCVNPNCPNKIVDKNGNLQPNYWACDDCDRGKGITWRRICCSEECFNEYLDFIKNRNETVLKSKISVDKVSTSTTKPTKKKTAEKNK